MDPELREKLLAIPGMPTNDEGDPPLGYEDKSVGGLIVRDFGLNADGRVVSKLLFALDGRKMHKPEECGRFFYYHEVPKDGRA